MKFIGDLKKGYYIIFETGLIVALLLAISAFKLPTNESQTLKIPDRDFDVVKTVDTPITKRDQTPATPTKPSVFNPVPDDVIIEDPIGNLDINWENSGNLQLPEESAGSEDDGEEIFIVVETEPQIKGGLQSLYDDLSYPREAKLAGIEGTVNIQFVVSKDGTVQDAKVIRGIGGGCDKEALRAVRNLTFKPGRQRGRVVKVQLSIPVRFDLK
ncbi:energy transducer TonB [Fodinibius halophilus]|uniref:Energy transducer TonB n=1 Tax=Fodinibius halophilus TaxID=1736908 RepID=A0A6M1TIV6_9BACT|nr:energy transducer TonB [Fodinibius halophilus]NGP89982.1 energy transducer TonB [Fodinibius halophilus]